MGRLKGSFSATTRTRSGLSVWSEQFAEAKKTAFFAGGACTRVQYGATAREDVRGNPGGDVAFGRVGCGVFSDVCCLLPKVGGREDDAGDGGVEAVVDGGKPKELGV